MLLWASSGLDNAVSGDSVCSDPPCALLCQRVTGSGCRTNMSAYVLQNKDTRGVFSAALGGKDNPATVRPAAAADAICCFPTWNSKLNSGTLCALRAFCRSRVDDCCRGGRLLISALLSEWRRGDGLSVSVSFWRRQVDD